MKVYKNVFDQIASSENLFAAWDAFKSNKRNRRDVQAFELRLEENIFQLHRDLRAKKYTHGPYNGFYVHDPKVRHIHKAIVRDRVLHHAIFTILNQIFEPTFISNSFSCRINKGTHKGVLAVEKMVRKVSRNYSRRCFVLKCDVKKFFDSVNHEVLLKILKRKIVDSDAMWLLTKIIESYTINQSNLLNRKGLPIGNLTSQLFANVYMNEFDQFVKHKLKVHYYARYTDDFVILADNKKYLNDLLPKISAFLNKELRLELHPKKVSIRKHQQGIDFLGYIALPYYRLLRAKTKRRIFRKLKERISQYKGSDINEQTLTQSLQSYLGTLSHANCYNLSRNIQNQYWFWLHE